MEKVQGKDMTKFLVGLVMLQYPNKNTGLM